ncbi:CLUMA_CG009050, isoform A [Clunio marinus]|uniref:CLUMA_CG009050, isoform A n=1 Tax=Clunio marinus TaxID=568069 RepID=A0A1J1I5H6_9DIPT|nr:CLUMA_CG009050, isoform A [Clunio marinus]
MKNCFSLIQSTEVLEPNPHVYNKNRTKEKLKLGRLIISIIHLIQAIGSNSDLKDIDNIDKNHFLLNNYQCFNDNNWKCLLYR